MNGNHTFWHRLQRKPWITAGFGLACGLILLGLLDLISGVADGDRLVPLAALATGVALIAGLALLLRK